ncbi:hypothetical protein LBMAG34_5150 [Candidatus Saccharibacteria bacterium]|nr:hypothetical protein LBMAG34_5150 [Candidatus Saccharibacteria bacterium]
MKALLFLSEKSTNSRRSSVDDLIKNLKINNIQLEKVDIDSARGAERAESYDVVSFPSLALIREDGAVVNIWQGELPDYSFISQSVGHI